MPVHRRHFPEVPQGNRQRFLPGGAAQPHSGSRAFKSFITMYLRIISKEELK